MIPITPDSVVWAAEPFFVRQGQVNFDPRNCFELHDNTVPELCSTHERTTPGQNRDKMASTLSHKIGSAAKTTGLNREVLVS